MNENSNIFINKRILIYGLGKSGLSSLKFLKGKNEVYIFDDNKRINLSNSFKFFFLSLNEINKSKFDVIILSPGIDIDKCKLSSYLKKIQK